MSAQTTSFNRNNPSFHPFLTKRLIKKTPGRAAVSISPLESLCSQSVSPFLNKCTRALFALWFLLFLRQASNNEHGSHWLGVSDVPWSSSILVLQVKLTKSQEGHLVPPKPHTCLSCLCLVFPVFACLSASLWTEVHSWGILLALACLLDLGLGLQSAVHITESSHAVCWSSSQKWYTNFLWLLCY